MRRHEQRAHAASELTLLGNTLYTQGDMLGAVIAYRRAARLAPPAMRAAVGLMLGLVLAELGDLRAAQRVLRRAARAEDQIIAGRARRTLTLITSDHLLSPPENLVRAPDIELLDRLARETTLADDRPEPGTPRNGRS
ncbi:tol-pal system YbgF family protein [Nonomuraea sp. GTA35]|uniref:tetratricopeptide repeat protein n=1 Tax=Nonomuraea sp. GTA35 TaxID=1676746 RepID=UPI0035C083B4